jgi:hypothetical protein
VDSGQWARIAYGVSKSGGTQQRVGQFEVVVVGQSRLDHLSARFLKRREETTDTDTGDGSREGWA